MARNPQDINPNDVPPRRNLPDDAEPWGRSMEDRIIALEKGYWSLFGSVQGANRFTASSGATMGSQISSIADLVYAIGNPISIQSQPGYYDILVGNDEVVNTTHYDLMTHTIAVPSGFTKAIVLLVANVGVSGTATAGDLMQYYATLTTEWGTGTVLDSPAPSPIVADSGSKLRGVVTFVLAVNDITTPYIYANLSRVATLASPSGKYDSYGSRTINIFTK